MTRFLHDLRFGLRMLAKRPAFSVLIILSLGLGIGANTAIFSAINAVMVKMLPVRQPQQLKMVTWTLPTSDFPESLVEDLEGNFARVDDGRYGSYSISYPAYEQIADNSHSFETTFAFSANDESVNLESNGRSANALAQPVSGNFFSGLGLAPAAGRAIQPSDDTASAAHVVVISHRLWQSEFGGQPSVIGQTIHVNGTPATIVGVAPAEFFGVQPGSAPDLWIPLHWYAQESAKLDGQNNPDAYLVAKRIWWVAVIGRLKPGVSEASAAAEVSLIVQRNFDRTPSQPENGIAAEYSGSGPASEQNAEAKPDTPAVGLTPISRGLDSLRRQFSTSLWLLMGMVGLVLLITCSNVAALLLTRAAARQRELAVRLSLGATRTNIVRQVLTESILLSMAGGMLGLAIARGVSQLLVGLLSSGRFPIQISLDPDPLVLAFTAAITVLCGLLFGIVPAWQAARVQPLTTLKQGGSGTSAATRQRSGKILVAFQIALSLVLLVACGLFLRTLQSLQKVDLGFDRENLARFTVRPGLNGYTDPQLFSYYQRLQAQLLAIPGVRSAAFAMHGAIDGGSAITVGTVPGYTADGKRLNIYRHDVSPAYFETLAIPILLGRAITAQDGSMAPKVAVVNEAFVRQYLHGENPIGHHIDLGSKRQPQDFTIVGLARNVKYGDIRAEAPPTAYFSVFQRKAAPPFMTFEVRGSLNESQLVPALQQAANSLDPRVPAVEIKTESHAVGEVLSLERTFATLSSSFGVLSLLLAAIGLYGTISYAIALRTNEIGIRMALGADRVGVVRMILREVLTVVALGLIIGLPVVWFASSLLRSQLFGLSPHDTLSIALAMVAIVAVSLFAGSIPARRAARIDPIDALRYE